MDRYKNVGVLSNMDLMMSNKYMTSDLTSRIYRACDSGAIGSKIITFKRGDRLDLISQVEYGNGMDWWLIAAASGLGWWLQINDDTIIRIPNRDQIREMFNL
jgi:hypothetical protein